jgi:hypothetical protein
MKGGSLSAFASGSEKYRRKARLMNSARVERRTFLRFV